MRDFVDKISSAGLSLKKIQTKLANLIAMTNSFLNLKVFYVLDLFRAVWGHAPQKSLKIKPGLKSHFEYLYEIRSVIKV